MAQITPSMWDFYYPHGEKKSVYKNNNTPLLNKLCNFRCISMMFISKWVTLCMSNILQALNVMTFIKFVFSLLIIIIIIYYIYIALFWVLKALYTEGGISSTTTICSIHIAPERPPHTSLLVKSRQSNEANQCMGMIRRPWWSEANGQIWPGAKL